MTIQGISQVNKQLGVIIGMRRHYMQDKILGVVSLGLSAACWAFIVHHDTETTMFFSVVFFAVGAYEFGLGVISRHKSSQ